MLKAAAQPLGLVLRATMLGSQQSRWRRLVLLMAGLLLTPSILLLGPTTPAYAHDCGGLYRHAVSPVSRADFVWDPWCSDGRSFIGYGSVEDTSCDARSAYAYFEVYDLNQSTGTYKLL